MNDIQRKLVIAALVVIGIVLPFLMLQWGNITLLILSRGFTPVYIVYEVSDAASRVTYAYGFYTQYGIAGTLFGIVAPLCLFAVALFITFGGRNSAS